MGITYEGEILLSSKETAAQLGITQRKVQELRKKGVLIERKVRGSRCKYVTLPSVLAYDAAEKVALREIAARVLILEQRVNELYDERSREGHLDALIRANHPHLL